MRETSGKLQDLDVGEKTVCFKPISTVRFIDANKETVLLKRSKLRISSGNDYLNLSTESSHMCLRILTSNCDYYNFY